MTESAVFTAPWDQKITVLTVLIATLLVGSTLFVVWLALARIPSTGVRLLLAASAFITIAALAGGVLFAPRRYAVHAGRLVVERAVRPVEIPLASIKSVELMSPDSLKGSMRVFGSGGLFGYYGRFRNRTLGDYRMYATRSDGYVLVRADRTYVLTPDAPDRFVAFVNVVREARSGGRS